MTFSPAALFLKTKLRGHNENLTKYNVIMLLSYIKRLIILNLEDSSARNEKWQYCIFHIGSGKRDGKNIKPRVRKTCLRICVPQLHNCVNLEKWISLCFIFFSPETNRYKNLTYSTFLMIKWKTGSKVLRTCTKF